MVSNECDDVLDNVAPCIEQKCGESALCIQQNDVAKEIKYAKEFRSRYAMFVNHCNINNGDYHCFTIRELPVFAIVSGLYKLSIK